MPSVTIDFARVPFGPPEEPKPKPTKMAEAKVSIPDVPLVEDQPEEIVSSLPKAKELGWDRNEHGLDPAKLEAAKATFVASGGNLSLVARTHDLAANVVKKLSVKHDWPVYGDGYASSEKTRKSKLESLAAILERQLHSMAEAMGVEKKRLNDVTEKGLASQYVAPLSQRSSAFSSLFDRYMRVMTLLEPELFGGDDDPSNPVAAKMRQKAHADALGGVDGINRQMADFAARVAVGVVEGMGSKREAVEAQVVDVTPE